MLVFVLRNQVGNFRIFGFWSNFETWLERNRHDYKNLHCRFRIRIGSAVGADAAAFPSKNFETKLVRFGQIWSDLGEI